VLKTAKDALLVFPRLYQPSSKAVHDASRRFGLLATPHPEIARSRRVLRYVDCRRVMKFVLIC
jgi:hypothetical protein